MFKMVVVQRGRILVVSKMSSGHIHETLLSYEVSYSPTIVYCQEKMLRKDLDQAKEGLVNLAPKE